MELTKIQFEDGQKVSDAYVEINGVKHNVTKAQYQGKTPLSARNLNKLQENVGNAISDLDERVVSYRNVLVDEQALIKECGGLKLKKLIKLVGKTEQEVRSGKNLLNSSSFEGAYYTIDGNITSKNTNALFDYISVNSNTKYTLSVKENIFGLVFVEFDENKKFILRTQILNTNKNTITTNSKTKYIRCVVNKDDVTAMTNTIVDNLKPQLELGEVRTEYEAYGKAPTPDFPSEVKTVTGNVEVKVGNENLYNTVLEGGSLSNGLNIENPEAVRSKDFVEIKPNTNYAFSVNGTLNRIIVSLYDINKKFISTDGSNGLVSADGLFKTYENAHYLRFRCYNADKTLFETGEIQLVEGVKAYQSQVFPLTLGDIKIYEDGYLISRNNKLYDSEIYKEIIFTGNENWSGVSGTNVYSYYLTIGDILPITTDVLPSVWCTHFKAVLNKSSYENGDLSQPTGGQKELYFTVSDYKTVEEWKSHLAEQYANGTPIKIVYKVATRVETEITNATLISQWNALENAQLYEGITNITITGDNLTPIADIDYWTWFKGESGESNNIYSTEEQVIGKWIDGKPLYRKVIETILPETAVNGTIVYENLYFSPYIDNGFIEFAYATNTSNQNVFIPYETDSGYRIKVIFQTDQLIIGNAIASYNGVPVLISVLYTKTTD